MDLDATSQLSPYLRFGMLSARQAAWPRCTRCAGGPMPGRARAPSLAQRIDLARVLHGDPPALSRGAGAGFQADYATLPGGMIRAAFALGARAVPAIRLWMPPCASSLQTGWMHNRARMIVASFLAKDLLIDWRWGERFLWTSGRRRPGGEQRRLAMGGGVGTDAAPYFRIFNPVLQGRGLIPRATMCAAGFRSWRVPDGPTSTSPGGCRGGPTFRPVA